MFKKACINKIFLKFSLVYRKPFFMFLRPGKHAVATICIKNSAHSLNGVGHKIELNPYCGIFHRSDISATLRALQRQNTEISKQIFPEKEYRGLSPNFHIYASVSDLYISTIGLPILLEEIFRPILRLYKSLTDT